MKVGVLQFFGVLGDLDDTPAGRRKPSFLGYHDFAALSGCAFAIGLAGLVFRTHRTLGAAACAAGGVDGVEAVRGLGDDGEPGFGFQDAAQASSNDAVIISQQYAQGRSPPWCSCGAAGCGS